MATEQTPIIIEQKLRINITKWSEFNDISIQQGSNTIYVDQDSLPFLIKGLIEFHDQKPPGADKTESK